MKTRYSIQINDLGFQADHISAKKHLSEEYDENPVATIYYVIFIKHREMKMISHGTKFISVEVLQIIIFVYSLLFQY